MEILNLSRLVQSPQSGVPFSERLETQQKGHINDNTDPDAGFLLVWAARYNHNPFKLEA